MKPIGAASRPPRCVSGPQFARAGMFRAILLSARPVRRPFARFYVADDLSAPLGQEPKPKKRFALPVRLSHLLAGALGLCVVVFAGWVVFADDPLGGEPMVVVSADPRGPAQSGGKAAEQASAPAPANDAAPADKSSAPGGKTITI